MKKIEFVCLGNNGRSPILEAVVRAEVAKKGLVNELQITSSGRYVNYRHPFNTLLQTLDKQLDKSNMSIYGSEERALRAMLEDSEIEKKYETDPEFRKMFLYYFDQVYRPLQAMDIALRNNVLARHGLEYISDRYQCPSQEGLDYIFTATKSLVVPVKELVGDAVPIITSLVEVAGIDDLKGGFGKFDISFYEGLYEGAKKVAPIIIERVMENDLD